MANGMEQFQKMVQQFLNEHADEFDSPVEAVDYFTRMYNEQNRDDKKFIQSDKENHERFYGVIDPDGQVGLEKFSHSLRDDPSNPLRKMKLDHVRVCYDAGLTTYEDFEELTEKTVLKLNGMCPVTIKELKANGVTFKK